ncbi:MAG: hypothetical protein QXV17_02595 [Candidatus Micrarchaeaceae archaeon]
MGQSTMEYVEVDQREIQRLGGQYAFYPTAKLIEDLIRPLSPRVLDVTFGKGRFYYFYRPKLLIGSDPNKWEWIVKPDIFYQLTVWALYDKLKKGEIKLPDDITLVVVDPPRWTRCTYRKREEYNSLIGTPDLIIQYANRTAQLLNATHLLLHYNTVPQLEKAQPTKVVKFRYLARYLNTENKNTSYYILYKLDI